MQIDPTIENYKKVFFAFVDKAKADPTKKYLQIQSFACHGYHVSGFQRVPTPYYDYVNKWYVMIPVEELVRTRIAGVPNAYCLVFFACCREVIKISKFEIEKQALEALTKVELSELSDKASSRGD